MNIGDEGWIKKELFYMMKMILRENWKDDFHCCDSAGFGPRTARAQKYTNSMKSKQPMITANSADSILD